LQTQIAAAEANGGTVEEKRKAMCRIQKAGYDINIGFAATVLKTPYYAVKEWVEERNV
jgi:hypothetical protein